MITPYIRLIIGALGAILLAGAGWWFYHNMAEIKTLRDKLAQSEANTAVANAAAAANKAALDQAEVQHQADLAAVKAHYESLDQITGFKTIVLEKIKNAPATDDGPIAPVLKLALDCLRNQAGSADGPTGTDCKAVPSGGLNGLPAQPASPSGK